MSWKTDQLVEITAVEQNKEERMKRNEDSLRDLWNNIKCTNICIVGAPEGEEREKGPGKIFEEIIAEKFPNMGKETLTQVQEVQRVPYRTNPRRNTLRHVLIKSTKIRNRENIKSNKGKATNNIQGNPIQLSADFSAETLQARSEWHYIFKVLKRKNLQPRILYPARLLLRLDREVKSFTDKQKLREFSTTKSALQQILKELL